MSNNNQLSHSGHAYDYSEHGIKTTSQEMSEAYEKLEEKIINLKGRFERCMGLNMFR